MTPRPGSLRAQVLHAATLVQRRALIALLALASFALPVALLLSWVVAPRAVAGRSFVPLLLDLFIIAMLAAGWLYWSRILRRRLGGPAVAAAAERRFQLQQGALRGVLELDENLPAGTSPALARLAEGRLQQHIGPQTPSALAGDVGEGWLRRARAAAVVLAASLGALTLLAFVSPQRSQAGWTPLLHPIRQLLPPALPPLEVLPGSARVPRGSALTVHVRAPGRDAVVLKWRLEGDVQQEQLLSVRGDTVSGAIAGVAARGTYWVEAPDGAVSPRYAIAPVDALLLADISIDVIYPAYLGVSPDHYQGDVPLLQLPAGSALRITGRATRPLSSAALRGSSGTIPFNTNSDRFSGIWTPSASGLYAWSLRDENARGLALTPPPLEVQLVADHPPAVEVTFPGTDTILPADLQQPLVAEARDDHGVASATLVSWRVDAAGKAYPPVETTLPFERGGESAVVRGVMDVGGRDLVPGDTLKYFVRVSDNAPAAQSGVSATYSLRLPLPGELRERASEQAREAIEQADAAAKRATELERQTRNADRNAQGSNARRSARSAQGGGQPGQDAAKMSFEETREARRVLEQQQAMLQQVEQLRAAMSAVEKSMADAGLRDPELQQRLEQMQQQLDRLLTPELKRQIEALQKAVQDLDPEAMQQALERLAEQQKDLKEQMDRTLELMKRAAAEQQLDALAQQARELATQQQALSNAIEEGKPAEQQQRAEQQRDLGTQADSLQQQLQQLAQSLERQGEAAAAQRTQAAAGKADTAAAAMQRAAQRAGQKDGEQSAQQGKQAAKQLEQAAELLDATRRELAEQWKQETEESLQQATQDALALAKRQQELQQQMEAGKSGQQQQQGAGAQQTPAAQKQGAGEQKQGSSQPGRQQAQQQGAQAGGQRSEQGGGQQQGGKQEGGQRGGQKSGGSSGQPGGSDIQQMRAEQNALQQGLEQLGKNLSETGQRSAQVSQEVGAALNRASTAMQQTQKGLEQAGQNGQLPAEQAAQAVDALNRLALSLLRNTQQVQQSESGTGMQQALQQLANAAQQQGSINGQTSSLQPLSLSPGATEDQVRRLGREQAEIAQKLGGMNSLLASREDVRGEVDAMAKEAAALAQQLGGGRLAPEVLERQQRLFHRLLDAGHTLEQEETSNERTAERPGNAPASDAPRTLDPRLLRDGTRFQLPSADELRALPPAYRKLILDYFERLNRPAAPAGKREDR